MGEGGYLTRDDGGGLSAWVVKYARKHALTAIVLRSTRWRERERDRQRSVVINMCSALTGGSGSIVFSRRGTCRKEKPSCFDGTETDLDKTGRP